MTKPRRVIIIIDDLLLGGSERIVANLCANLPRVRYTASVLGLFAGGPLAREIQASGTPVKILGMTKKNLFATFPLLLFHLWREKCEVAHCFRPGGRTIGSLAAWLTGVPTIIIRWGSMPETSGPIWRRLEALACRWSTHVQACSRAVASRISRYYRMPRAQTVAVYNGIFTDMPPQSKNEIRKSLGLPTNATLIGITANHRKEKNYPCLIRASARVLREFRDALFVSVGGGPELFRNKRLAALLGVERSWRFLGPHDDAQFLCAAFDIFALPSLTEGFGVVLLEAMRAGLPCVAADAGAISEVVVHGGTGLLFKCDDDAALAAHICRLLGNARERKALGKAGRERLMSTFTVERMIEGTQKLYD